MRINKFCEDRIKKNKRIIELAKDRINYYETQLKKEEEKINAKQNKRNR